MNEITPEGLDIEDRFKDPHDPLQLVFVCAMWLTGFDVPSLSTLYLDKPTKDHTLMQCIARANRCFEGKKCGLIVDYVNVKIESKMFEEIVEGLCFDNKINIANILHVMASIAFKCLKRASVIRPVFVIVLQY